MNQNIRVLLVEDSATDAELVIRELRRAGFDPLCTRVDTEESFLSELDASPDLILSDYSLPQFDGLEAFKLLQESGRDIPFILVSGTVGEEIAVESMRVGVADFLLKDRLARLGPAVQRAFAGAKLLLESRCNADLLNASEKRYRRLFESAKDGILILDYETGTIKDVNPFLIELLGITKDEFLRQKVWELGFIRHLIANQDKFHEVQQHDYVRYDNLPLEAGDGRRIDVEFVSNVYEVDGTKVIQCNIRDITERRQMEALLRIQDRAMQSASEGIIITDASGPDCPVIYANQGFEAMTGYSSAEVIGRNCRFLQGRDTDPTAVASIRESMRERKPVTVELLNYRKDGTTFWNKMSITPICNESGNLTHFVGIQSDVTARRHTQEQLRQSDKMEVVGQLAGGIAHDFNNMLAAIDCYTNMLFHELLPTDPAWKLLQEIQSTSTLAAGLTRQLLTFSGHQNTSPASIELNAVIIESMNLLKHLTGEDIELDVALAPNLKNIWMDRVQVSQILINLSINARDAMARGGRLSIRTESRALTESKLEAGLRIKPGDYIVLTVADNGHGMSAEILAKIFQPFYTTKPRGKGTGLGLATVYTIVTQYHGLIEVVSELGIGTTFRIFWPVLSTSLQIAAQP